MSIAHELESYVARYFVSRAEFARAAAVSDDFLQRLIDAEAIPAVIYSIWTEGTVWSPIGAWVGTPMSSAPTSQWYSAAALWWARRAAALHDAGLTDTGAIAARFREGFAAEFQARLKTDPSARVGYADLFEDGAVDNAKCHALALSEWADWINGGYGVCLRRFDANHLIAKTSQSARIRQLTAAGTKPALSPDERLDLLDALDHLDAVMLPFAPHQRPHGTPGKWIDAIMEKYGLGAVPLVQHRSQTIAITADDRLCA